MNRFYSVFEFVVKYLRLFMSQYDLPVYCAGGLFGGWWGGLRLGALWVCVEGVVGGTATYFS